MLYQDHRQPDGTIVREELRYPDYPDWRDLKPPPNLGRLRFTEQEVERELAKLRRTYARKPRKET